MTRDALTATGEAMRDDVRVVCVFRSAERDGVSMPEALAARAGGEPGGVTLVVTDDMSIVNRVRDERGVIPVLVETDTRLPGSPQYVSIRRMADLQPLVDLPPDAALFAPFRHSRRTFSSARRARMDGVRDRIDRAEGVHIAGAGTIGRQIAAEAARTGIRVHAFIDNDARRHGSSVGGLRVLAPKEIDAVQAVVIPASGLQAFAQMRQLQSSGFASVVTPSEFFVLAESEEQPEPRYLDDLWDNRMRYLTLFAALADSESRRVLEGVLRHRLTLSLAPLAEVVDTVNPQWFDPALVPAAGDHVFVDGGAFDGDTVLGFVNATGGRYRAIHAFEPDPALASRARERTQHLPNVTVTAAGLGAAAGRASFATTGSTDGRVAAAADGAVHIDALDRLVPEPITYLKLDVEGAEADAIAGGARHIAADRPVVAAAVYHKAHDLWDLPGRIANLVHGCRFYLRHYTQMAFETVLYARPGDETRVEGTGEHP